MIFLNRKNAKFKHSLFLLRWWTFRNYVKFPVFNDPNIHPQQTIRIFSEMESWPVPNMFQVPTKPLPQKKTTKKDNAKEKPSNIQGVNDPNKLPQQTTKNTPKTRKTPSNKTKQKSKQFQRASSFTSDHGHEFYIGKPFFGGVKRANNPRGKTCGESLI